MSLIVAFSKLSYPLIGIDIQTNTIARLSASLHHFICDGVQYLHGV